MKEKLILRDSFKLPFSGGEIWSEELDGLNVHTDIVTEKFLKEWKRSKGLHLPDL